VRNHEESELESDSEKASTSFNINLRF